MAKARPTFGIAAAAVCAALTLASKPSYAQEWGPDLIDPVKRGWELATAKVKPGVLPSTSSKAERDKFMETLPDWSGVWANASGNGTIFDTTTADPPDARGMSPFERHWPPYNLEYEKKYNAFLDRLNAGYISDTLTYCLPKGMPRIMSNPHSYEFIVTPEKVLVFNEDDSQVRRIHTDGRYHPPADELVPTWQGHSTGYWDGDTLVIETVGVRAPQMIEGIHDQITDRSGPMLSGSVRFTERMRKISDTMIENIVVVHDPIALQKPWVVKRLYAKQPDDHLVSDQHCEEAQSTSLGERNIMVDGVTQAILPTDAPGYFLKPEQIVAPERSEAETPEEPGPQ